jgi:hypothetical protein
MVFWYLSAPSGPIETGQLFVKLKLHHDNLADENSNHLPIFCNQTPISTSAILESTTMLLLNRM